jgi:hypothetical protein
VPPTLIHLIWERADSPLSPEGERELLPLKRWLPLLQEGHATLHRIGRAACDPLPFSLGQKRLGIAIFHRR